MREIPALKVRQWLPEWNAVRFDSSKRRRKPPEHFYLFSISAGELRALSGIQRRTDTDRQMGSTESGIQRRHDERRSGEIQDYLKYGFPFATFSNRDRAKYADEDSKMPGWLPTAIVINVFNSRHEDVRKGQRVLKDDHVLILDRDGPFATVRLPDGFEAPSWSPTALPPVEIIDGQHRLWAIDDSPEFSDYELPVVAFYGLDLTWQAYLFYTINIRPVKINTSLAYDLYPLLRTERWLEHERGPLVYRETRAQEIVEALYTHPVSPWHNHINMLGDPGRRMVRQSAWIRSFLATYIRSPRGARARIGGLFASVDPNTGDVLDWHGAQQVAFIIYLGNELLNAIGTISPLWARELREADSGSTPSKDPAFYGRHSLLNTDQGIRGFLSVTNDVFVECLNRLELHEWVTDEFGKASDEHAITDSVHSLSEHSTAVFIKELIDDLAEFDWRTSSAPKLTEEERTVKLTFRGGGGYNEIRRRLLEHLAGGVSYASEPASTVLEKLGFGVTGSE